ncbi:MAG: BPSS1780 family membrane protein [Rugosibacter sp.]
MNAQRLPARHGVLWLIRGWRLLRRHPRPMMAVTMAYFVVAMIINMIPHLGPFLLPLVIPMLTALLGNAYRTLDHDQLLSPEHITAGLREQRTKLLRLGGLHLLGSVILLAISLAVVGDLNPAQDMTVEQARDMLLSLSFVVLCASPLLMAFWFAPLLTAWAEVAPLKALFFSLVASWRNWRAFAVYGLVIMAAGMALGMLLGALLAVAGMISPALMRVLSILPPILMVMLLGPVLAAGIYISYSDVFHTAEVIDA